MLHDIKDLEGYAMGATDGELGTVMDFYFDDQYWTIRYLMVETGGWLSGRKVLISPSAVLHIRSRRETIDVRLARQQVKDSPSVNTHKPVSRQHEMIYADYYGYPYYWTGGYALDPFMDPIQSAESSAQSEAADSHLRSTNDVIGHEAMASDGPIGRVHSFVFDDASWNIRHLVVNTGNWWPGKRVLLSPGQIQRISWRARDVYLDLTRQEVKASPEYTHQFEVM
jgi:hypothetical protein